MFPLKTNTHEYSTCLPQAGVTIKKNLYTHEIIKNLLLIQK